VRSIIKVSNLGKKYIIAHDQPRRRREYRRFSEEVAAALTWPARMLGASRNGHANGQPKREEFWALRDVEFEVQQGEVVGIIGRNGAGKSTLLKLLSRITEPTTGRIELRGRVASLLEVGTGFHPELTGRENIFLNGAILGMSKAEIKRKFDEIVAFAEVERFLDTPVKRYSSGMHVRLGFAVAAHLEPEILIVDEVLAVGDADFQKKCLGKMRDVSTCGRTVLFVSHNMGAIRTICQRCILVANGRIDLDGEPAAIVTRYLNKNTVEISEYIPDPKKGLPGNELVRLLGIAVRGEGGAVGPAFPVDMPIKIEVKYRILQPVSGLRIGLQISGPDGTVIFTTTDADESPKEREIGDATSCCHFPGSFFHRGPYSVTVGSDTAMKRVNFYCENVISFSAIPIDAQASRNERRGLINPAFLWETHTSCDSTTPLNHCLGEIFPNSSESNRL
jgi:lipopolysaccharide transport system ATP-binding protein